MILVREVAKSIVHQLILLCPKNKMLKQQLLLKIGKNFSVIDLKAVLRCAVCQPASNISVVHTNYQNAILTVNSQNFPGATILPVSISLVLKFLHDKLRNEK